jgi:hypothetical protein
MSEERNRLYAAVVEAFRKLKEAFGKNPQPGTPEWREWQRLFDETVEANDAFLRSRDRQFPHEPPFSESESD